ncbi:metalloregulator ArsR/SmtB family transcription factor [Ideonella sp. DXS29W]|uniref:Metalloregulator ArsR/SmtB family transcription factor n=1 Tax=Ideonella lacteola TaxID=2984193 RepID=A0ABU9BXK5_9BURK
MEEKDVIRALAALAQPVRLQVFRALIVAGSEGLTPGTMADALAVPQNTLSFHLKELTNAGLVTTERASRHIIYRAAFDHMNAVLTYLTENCCRGAACVVEPAASCGC